MRIIWIFVSSDRANGLNNNIVFDVSSRAEVEKQKANMKLRSQACEEAKMEYTDQLRKTNEAQRQHYEQRLPHVFKQLQVQSRSLISIQL